LGAKICIFCALVYATLVGKVVSTYGTIFLNTSEFSKRYCTVEK